MGLANAADCQTQEKGTRDSFIFNLALLVFENIKNK